MVVYGTVVDKQINVDIEKQDKSGVYKGYRLAYRADDGTIKQIAKHMASLKNYPSVSNTLKDLQIGEDFTVSLEKSGDFWNVVSLSKGKLNGDALPDPISNGQGTPAPVAKERTPYPARSTGNTYETPEERTIRRKADAVRQRLIIRQSSVTSALTYYGDPRHEGNTDQVLKLAGQFEEYVLKDLEIPY